MLCAVSDCVVCVFCVLFFKQKTAYEMRISDWSSDVCSSDLAGIRPDYRRLGSGRAAGLVQFTPHRRLAGGWADASGGLSADGVVSPGAVHQVAEDRKSVV